MLLLTVIKLIKLIVFILFPETIEFNQRPWPIEHDGEVKIDLWFICLVAGINITVFVLFMWGWSFPPFLPPSIPPRIYRPYGSSGSS